MSKPSSAPAKPGYLHTKGIGPGTPSPTTHREPNSQPVKTK